MSKSGGVFQIDDVTRTMSKGGRAPGVPPIQVQTPPPTWLAGYGPDHVCLVCVCVFVMCVYHVYVVCAGGCDVCISCMYR